MGSGRWVSRSQLKVDPNETPSRLLEPRSGPYAGFSSRRGFRLDGFIIGNLIPDDSQLRPAVSHRMLVVLTADQRGAAVLIAGKPT